MSVRIGNFNSSFTRPSASRPFSIPSPRKLLIDDRFALSNEFLKKKPPPASVPRFEHPRAIINTCSSLSTTQGPAIIVSRPSPNVAGPTEKGLIFITQNLKRLCEYTLDLIYKRTDLRLSFVLLWRRFW